MAIETVRISVLSDAVVPVPVDDVVVRVYDATGATLITSGTTGAVLDGAVEFSLPNAVYQLRFYIDGGAILSPQRIEVFSPPASSPTGTNNFEVEAALFTLPPATSPQLCRCSGYVKGPNGRPRRGVDIMFIPQFNRMIVGGDYVGGERLNVRSDDAGYVSCDLYRGGCYAVVLEGHENITRQIMVPDRSSVLLSNLLFPIPVSVTLNPAGAITLVAGTSVERVPTVTCSDYRVLDKIVDSDVSYSVDNTAVATVTNMSDRIVIRGLVPGTTYLRVKRLDTSIIYTPDPGIAGGVVAITVT